MFLGQNVIDRKEVCGDMKKGQTRLEYLILQKQKCELQQKQLAAKIRKEELEQQIYLHQAAAANRKARTRRLIQIGAIYAREFEVIEQYELDEIADFFRRAHDQNLEPSHKNDDAALSIMGK